MIKKYFFIGITGLVIIFFGLSFFNLVNKNNLLQSEKEINIFHQKRLLERLNNFSKGEKELVKEKILQDNTINKLYSSIKDLQNKSTSLSQKNSELEVNEKYLQSELDKFKAENERLLSDINSLKTKEEDSKASMESVNKKLDESLKKNDKLTQELKDAEKERRVALDQVKKALGEKEEAFKKIAGEKDSLQNEREKYSKEIENLKKQLEDKENKLAKIEKEGDKFFEKRMEEKLSSSIKLIEQKLAVANKKIEELNQNLSKEKENNKKIKFTYYYNSGILYAQNRQYDEAIQEYEKALKIDENNSQAHYNMAIIFDGYGNNPRKAVFHYEKYLELKPDAKDAEKIKEWLKAAREKVKK